MAKNKSFGRRGGGRHRMVPVVKPKNFKETIKRLGSYFKKETKLLVLTFILVIGSSLLALLVPYFIGKAIDTISFGKMAVNFKMLKIFIAILLSVHLVEGIMTFLQGWIMAGISQRIVFTLRKGLFNKLQKLPLSYFDTHSHGEIMSRLSNDIDNVSTTISQSTVRLMSSIIAIVGAFIMMLILSLILTLASMITIPMVFFLTNKIAKKTRVLFKEQQRVLGQLNGHIEETISGIEVVKAFNNEDRVIEEFENVNMDLCDVGIKAQIWSGFLMPIMNVINNFGFAVVAVVGGVLAIKEMITIGILASFLSYSRQFVRPLNTIANTFNTLQSGVAGAERVFEVLDEAEEKEDLEDAVILKDVKGDVVFDNVSFGYKPDNLVLKNVDINVKEGTNVALVGSTGAGKTTIVNLLTRFYDVLEGEILIDGIDIRKYSRDSLRKAFGMVLQDTYLFSGTVGDNIRYGKLNSTNEEVKGAAVMANADQFIRRLPKGYNTMLSEGGTNLSQGERQLLAIARAILANPSILILDEATSSVDTRTELRIQEAMLKLMENRTTFIIAHRLSTIRDADVIMVIDNGRIIEKGNHDELIIKKGAYYELYNSQFMNESGFD